MSDRAGSASMTLEQLLAEGRALARPVVHLVPSPPTPEAGCMACYRGPDGSDQQRWLCIDLRAHPDPACRLSALLSIHADPATGEGHTVPLEVHDLLDEPEKTGLYHVQALEL